jgi:hypothetical protein
MAPIFIREAPSVGDRRYNAAFRKECLMPRPHEDLEHHTPVDHRVGGAPVTFAPGSWCAVDVAHVAAERIGAGISTYETLIEKARTSSAKARTSAVLRSVNNRRVVALVQIDGHEGFRHIQAAWDDHHLNAERHTVAESQALGLFTVTASAGDASLDPASSDAYAFEHIARDPQQVRDLLKPLASAPGFRGALLFGTDDPNASAIIYRFSHSAQIDAFRTSSAAVANLGPLGGEGETLFGVHPVKTFT